MLSVICMWPMQKTCKLQETLPRIWSFLTHALTNGCTNLTIYVHNFKLANLLSILANKGLAHYLCRLSILCKQLLPNLEGKRNQVELVMQ
jgi:hypothetical protein